MARKIKQEKPDQKLTAALLQDVKNLSHHKTEYGSLWIRRTPKALPIPKPKKQKRISKNTAYKRGRNFEYRVKKHFERNGYYVVRKYASKGAEDLIAIKRVGVWDNRIRDATQCSEVLLIQCKNLKVEKKLKREDAERLIALAKQCGATPLLASNQNHKLNIIEVT